MQKRQDNIEHAMKVAKARQQKRRRLDGGQGGELDADVIEVLYTRFIAAHHESLRLVECAEFRALLTYLNPETDAWLPEDHKTIQVWILRQFSAQKALVRILLANAVSDIHMSTDLWRSPSRKEFLAVTAEGVDENEKPFHLLLGLKELKGSKAGEFQAPLVLEVIRDFNIQGKLGYFVMDNDGTNDTMLRFLARRKFNCIPR